jgi:hypothetical protein
MWPREEDRSLPSWDHRNHTPTISRAAKLSERVRRDNKAKRKAARKARKR